ncbi:MULTISPECIES: molybdopterin-guanine dinucleotide biosynthesis protein B [unclassified Paenibacillus]|uniref:molybdopterin-guanine dinucleotide biosynthesis protein B n=1 Tax=unclassified Paenibacillus TaxID=185978 RepID=UPI001AE741B1|nr:MULTISPECIES: molybdopterin-guanine dinucleotide biosynthesis protein B [unclassified Paenibacillus]MBP1154783.1 molybdopterin-guanine dinucleotide biosynthesis protein B [Paenibacillus sp. PvP091]MBP1169833.1 molybdopterin-guanine dinucleotide biosynthesis protein B [Paenibacillus sp. PvR098]MBP2440861.1 molybdopterin-guanine dinucleotide biosynthesis protein B [Paenibacillus sp. PvP052]
MKTKVIGFTGYANSGKTTLIRRLTEHYEASGVKVAIIKHDGHGHYKEVSDTDSAQFIESGASASIVISPDAVRTYEKRMLSLSQVIEGLQERFHLIMVEGFKRESHAKIAVFRTEEQAEIVRSLAEPPIAWVTADIRLASGVVPDVPVFHPDDIESIASFIENL